MPDPPGTQWLRSQRQQIQNPPHIVQMHPSVWHRFGLHRHDWANYEATVDNYIKQRGLKKGDHFHVMHHGAPRSTVYKYLGPNSGRRKDWEWVGRKRKK